MSLSGTFTEDNLFAGDFKKVTKEVVVLTGQTLTRGAILGKITASGKYKHTNVGASDGSEVGSVVLAKDLDTTSGDANGIVYLTGEFNENSLNVSLTPTGTDTPGAHADELRDKSIFLKGAVAESGIIT